MESCSKDPIGFSGGDNNIYRYVRNSPSGYLDPLGFARHHWFMKYHGTPGKGQNMVDALCRCPTVNIDDFTTDYPQAQHDWIHGGWGGAEVSSPFMKYQELYESVVGGSKTCCDLLTKMMAMMYAHHQALVLAHARGLAGSDPVPPFDLIAWRTRRNPPVSNVPKFSQHMLAACGRDPIDEYLPLAREYLDELIKWRNLDEPGVIERILDEVMPYGIPLFLPTRGPITLPKAIPIAA